jgi:ubiquinol-cytochrome c reductase cytochrome b subunit
MGRLRSVLSWLDDRTGVRALLGPALSHPVPADVNWFYVLGSATLAAFVLQVVSGVALAFAFVPSSGQAYDSLQFITSQALLGRFIRGVHYFGASAMVLLVGLHAIRVFIMAAYKYPREMSWVSGVVLLGLTVTMGFTGQLLRWDQNAVWSVIVGAEQAGRVPLIGHALAQFILAGKTLGGATLSRFFAIHVFLIPALIFGFLGLHLHLVLRNGISEPPRTGHHVDPASYREWYHGLLAREGVPFWPEAAWRDAVAALVVMIAVFALALAVGPPALGKPPDPTIIQADPRPDWYLLWYFAVLALLPHGTETYVIVGAPLLIGLVLLVVPFISNRGARSPKERPWAVGAVLGIVTMIGTLWIAGVHANWSPDFNAPPLPATVVQANDNAQVERGALLFHERGCEYCHSIAGFGGHRGPELTPDELNAIVAFLQTRR